MKRLLPLLPIALGALWSAAAAQAQIYESKDKSGAPVFSDTPSPGSKDVTLPAPNISDAPMPSVQRQAPATPAYSELSIVSPSLGGTLHTNTGEFDVKVNLSPALNSNRGDRFVVKLDGTTLPGRYTSPTIEVTSQDFAAAATENVQHQLDVSVVDKNGKILIAASPLTFYIQGAGVHRRSRRR